MAPSPNLIGFIDSVGGPEMMLIFVIVLILFGGKKLPEFARGLGKTVREFKKAAAGVEEEFKRALEEDEQKAAAARVALPPPAPSLPPPPPPTPLPPGSAEQATLELGTPAPGMEPDEYDPLPLDDTEHSILPPPPPSAPPPDSSVSPVPPPPVSPPPPDGAPPPPPPSADPGAHH